jgi:hypothetical protein
MNMIKYLCLTSVLALTVGAEVDLRAAVYTHRQYYSSWQKHPQRNYHYRYYYYKPTPTYAGYQHHYVVYFPQRPKHLYYYNPYKKVYWGRCPTDCGGREQYSLLAEKDRKASVDEIPEAAFPKPAAMPPIPESTDGAKVDLPPDDLPGEAGLPK